MFAWLLLTDRLNNKDMIQRRHWKMTDNYNCFLCVLGIYMKIEIIHSFIAILVSEYEIICRFLGEHMAQWYKLLRCLGGVSSILFSLKRMPLLAGIFGK
jgi:hypothetical protein